MRVTRSVAFAILCIVVGLLAAPNAGAQQIYNTAKQKLAQGKQVMGGTVLTADPEIYCAMANSGWDFLWIEMQHSTLTFQEVAHMVRACKGAPAMPFIRVPNATEGDIQKAVDLGAMGIIIPMVDTVEKVQNAVKFAKYPPVGMRSQGNGQYGAMWGPDYRANANANIMIVALIENPAGAAIADQIAAVPGVDVIFAASTDLSSFSGLKQGDPQYEALVKRIRDTTLAAGRKLGGPIAWRDRADFTFFQGPPDTTIIRMGSEAALGAKPAPAQTRGVAPTEGSER